MKAIDIKNIRDTQQFLAQLYPNSARDFSYIYGYADRHQGYLSKELTKKSDPRIQFIKSTSWLFALASHLEVDLMGALIGRHPDVCPYCLSGRCVCIVTEKLPFDGTPAHKIPRRLQELAASIEENPNQTLGKHAERINNIYPGNRQTYSAFGAWQLAAKLQEELSEVHEAGTRYLAGKKPKSAVAEELADTFAWLLASWDIVYPSIDFQDELIQFYSGGCPECSKEQQCSCDVYADRSSELVDNDRLLEIEGLLLEMAKSIEGLSVPDTVRVRDAQESLRMARETQSEPVARTATHQATNLATSLESKLEKSAKNAGNAAKFAEAIRSLAENLPFF